MHKPTNIMSCDCMKHLSRKRKNRRIRPKTRRYMRKYKGGNSDTQTCDICLEPKILCTILPCKHEICQDCFNLLKEKKCPFCRGNVTKLLCRGEIIYQKLSIKEMEQIISDYLGVGWYNASDTFAQWDDIFSFVPYNSSDNSINRVEFDKLLKSMGLKADYSFPMTISYIDN